jgi:hypothetical protein
MKLLLERTTFTDKTTIGKTYVDGVFECYILEDKDRRLEEGGVKVPGETAIPRGTYPVIITYSNRFKTELPLLKNVPGYEGVRIHPGNYAKDTEGCLLPGSGVGEDMVLNSRATFAKLFKKIDDAIQSGADVEIEIK